MPETRAAIVLAAGKGKRMKSDLPKVLHEIDGRPMVRILLDTLLPMRFERIVVVIGHKGEMVQEALRGCPVEFAWQREQLGTGHAVMMTKELLGDFAGTTLVAAGDVPFLSRRSLEALLDVHSRTGAAATCLSAVFANPYGYGRIVREGNTDMLAEIVEEKDASDEVRRIR
ncbi:MAG TPA: NTP transferase domain-containing protein, partial [candidate division Zixibacteria bacterium]|nr:NTP transferase domain-containing protein [candidate division Zixibacteria bacterium]